MEHLVRGTHLLQSWPADVRCRRSQKITSTESIVSCHDKFNNCSFGLHTFRSAFNNSDTPSRHVTRFVRIVALTTCAVLGTQTHSLASRITQLRSSAVPGTQETNSRIATSRPPVVLSTIRLWPENSSMQTLRKTLSFAVKTKRVSFQEVAAPFNTRF